MPTDSKIPPVVSPPVRKEPVRRHASYPLAFLFVITAYVASILAFVRPAMVELLDGKITGQDFAKYSIATGVCASVVGAILGLYHHRRMKGLLLGGLSALLTGAALGPTLLSSAHEHLLLAALGGSTAIVVTGIAFLRHRR